MERVKSLLSPGRHADDEMMYGSATDQLKKGGLNTESSHVEDVDRVPPDSIIHEEPIRQPQTSDIVLDSSPERSVAGQEYNTTGTRTDGPIRDEMPARDQGPVREEIPGVHQAPTESNNPYTKHTVDPRIGGSKQQSSAQDESSKKTSSEYSKEQDVSRSQPYTDTSKAADNTTSTHQYGRDAAIGGVAAGGAAAAGHHMKGDDTRTNAMNQEYSDTSASGTNPNYFAVPPGAEASGPYKTRIASLIDPHQNTGGSAEDAYYHSPSGGGGETADTFHRRRSRTISVTKSGGEAREAVQANRPVSTEGHSEPQDASRRSQGTWATAGAKGDETGKEDYGSLDKEAERGGVGAHDYVQTPYEGQQGQPTATATQPTATATQPTATATQPTATATQPTATTTQSTETTAQPKTAADYYSSTGGDTHAGTSGKQYDVEVPRGNHYGKKVDDPRYGLPLSATGVTWGEAETLRNQNQAEAIPTGATQRQAETIPPKATQRQAQTNPTGATQREAEALRKQNPDVAAKSASKGGRRSSILEFLHLGGKGKKDSKEEAQLANQERQVYAEHDRAAPIGTAAARTSGAGSSSAGSGAERHPAQAAQKAALSGEPATLVQRNRQQSTIDAPAFSGGVLDENGNPLDTSTARKLPESTAGFHKGHTTGKAGARGAPAGTDTADRASMPKAAAPQPRAPAGLVSAPAGTSTADRAGAPKAAAPQQVPPAGLADDRSAPADAVAADPYGGAKVTETEDEGLVEDYEMQGPGRGVPGGALSDDISPHSSAAGMRAAGSGAGGRSAKVAERGGHHVLHKNPPVGHAAGIPG